MARQSITFTPPNDDWLKVQVESQEYSSKSEVVNDLIRKARHQHEEVEAIRAKLIRAEKSGFTKLTPEIIRENAKKHLKSND
ncbi:ribbon-helix-helix domain-containing protein [Marinospirillum minutulum]|uniref:ribbon-helix-helix domain-containing protein n=1 Tax=Marinospirillum minutulum TaxID=64974 RepID=UPI0003FB6A67|nr:type II toxin-antitoxin system ParD family antitoxin [Marinospirillum minutulum]